jgi:hypothetical protein
VENFAKISWVDYGKANMIFLIDSWLYPRIESVLSPLALSKSTSNVILNSDDLSIWRGAPKLMSSGKSLMISCLVWGCIAQEEESYIVILYSLAKRHSQHLLYVASHLAVNSHLVQGLIP